LDLADPAFLIALALGVVGFALYMKLQPPPPRVPQCLDCGREMERGDEYVDPENPERRFIPGERQAYFHCPSCRRRVRARY
jgi:hypothetical protein